MKTKRLLLAIFMAFLTPLATLADVWQDPETKVNYEYVPGSGVAKVKAGNLVIGAGSPDAKGDIELPGGIIVDGNYYFLTTIGVSAFRRCSDLNSITIPETVTHIEANAFAYCSNLKEVILSDGLTSIGGNAFAFCSSMTSIDIPNSVTVINEEALQGCSSLIDAKLPKDLARIETSTFSDCRSLKRITIPSCVVSIGYNAFSGCSGLKEINSRIAEPFSINYNTFPLATYQTGTLYVPVGTLSKYKDTPAWSYFESIKEIEDDHQDIYAVVGTTDLTGYYWDTTKNKMTFDAESSIYTWTADNITVNAESNLEFKIVKNEVIYYPQFNSVKITPETIGGEGVFTIAITFSPETEEIAVNAIKTGEINLPELNTYTVTFTNNIGWEKVYAYAWSGETIEYLGKWPGAELEGSEGVYKVTIESETAPEFIIFNDGKGNKTKELIFEDGKAYNLTNTTDAILPYGQFSQKPWQAKGFYSPNSNDKPADDWYLTVFDDSDWDTIAGPLRSEDVSAYPPSYWPTYYVTPFQNLGHYWLRRHFRLNSVNENGQYFLYVTHDDNCTVYINGIKVYEKDIERDMSIVTIDSSILKSGDNVVAAYVYDFTGIAFIDYGLYTNANVDISRAFIAANKQLYLPGEKVKINGMLTDEYANSEIEVYVKAGDLSQTIPTKTNEVGEFAAEWTPYSGQMGHFTIGAGQDGKNLVAEQAAVDVIGIRRTSNGYITCETKEGTPYEGTIEVENPCSVEQLLNEVEVTGKPEGCTVTIEKPATIAAGGKAMIKYTLTGNKPSEGQDWEQMQLHISTAEGAIMNQTLYYYCHPAKAVLAANENSISTTMTKGTSRDYPLYIANKGKGATGKIWLSMPDVDYLKCATPTEMPSLEYDETATIMLRLTPTANMPLNVPQTGTIGINCENGDGLAINYAIEAVSEQTGTLVVDVLDEFSLNDGTGPHLSGAAVEIKHPTSGEVIVSGTTDADGKFSTELPEGYYAISVSADRHSTYSNNLLIDPGRKQTHEAFLSYEAISYSWTMEETEVEDQYEITITSTFETNVPKPVLVITLPDKKPVPGEVFPVTVTNHGLINTEHVDLTTVISQGFTIEILNRETLSVLAPEQSHTYYCVIRDEADLWSSSCIDAYVVADGYYQCRGLRHVQARADMYRCTSSSSTSVDTVELSPIAIGPGGPSFVGDNKVSGGTTGGSAPWINWPCESCLARVKMEIKQTLGMSRPAYRGTLTLFNGHETTAMTNVRLNLTITDTEGKTANEKEFAIIVESLDTFAGEQQLPGGWTLGANQTGQATVLFIPTGQAAPDGPKDYTFGGTLNCIDPYSGQGLTLPLNPTTFTVQPLPELELTYLMQRDVYGDDPLTEGIAEPMAPAEFALIINNKGNGDAKNVRIVTEQPKIVENDKGLLIDFDIVGSQVNGEEACLVLGQQSITNPFGTIAAHSQTYAQWWLTSTLLGHFISYEVEANHKTSYGNSDLSLISKVAIHEMIHGFTPIYGQKRAWIVNDTEDENDQPDVVYLSDATTQPLHTASGSAQKLNDNSYQLTINTVQAGWNYGSVADPTDGHQEIAQIVRQSDGQEIPLDNVWQTDRTLRDSQEWLYEHRLHFVVNTDGAGETYVVRFKEASSDVKPLIANTASNDVLFDLQGRMIKRHPSVIGRLSKGIYIRNGKKTVVK